MGLSAHDFVNRTCEMGVVCIVCVRSEGQIRGSKFNDRGKLLVTDIRVGGEDWNV